MDYKDPFITKLIEKFNAEGPEELRHKYKYGDVLIVPKDELPIVTIAKQNLSVGDASNYEDDHVVGIIMNVLYDYTKDLTQDYDIVAGVNSLYGWCEGRGSDYQLLPKTLLAVLRKYQVLDKNVWISIGPSETTRVDYGIGRERRGQGIFSVEAAIRFNIHAHLIRPT